MQQCDYNHVIVTIPSRVRQVIRFALRDYADHLVYFGSDGTAGRRAISRLVSTTIDVETRGATALIDGELTPLEDDQVTIHENSLSRLIKALRWYRDSKNVQEYPALHGGATHALQLLLPSHPLSDMSKPHSVTPDMVANSNELPANVVSYADIS